MSGRPRAVPGSPLERWDRLALGVRCAYDPTRPALIRRFLDAGRRLEDSGTLDAPTVQRRAWDLLIRTALDTALPWPWRLACLDHTTLPRARLTTLLRRTDPAALAALEVQWQAAVAAVEAARHARSWLDDEDS